MKILVDNIIINYEIIGEGDKNIVILHGWGRSLNEWVCIAREIPGYKFFILDLPGFGLSEEPQNAIDIFEYSEIILKFLNKLMISDYSIIGHSFGGRIGTILASSNDTKIKKLILVDSGGIEIKSLKIKLLIILSKILNPIKYFLPKKILRNFGSSDYKNISGVLRNIFIKTINQDLRFLFPKIKIPVVVIWGSDDTVLPVDYVKIYRSIIKNVSIRIVWEANHSPHISKKEDFINILKNEL